MSQTTSPSPLTVVFVHGAFADSSSWTGVLERLQANNVQVGSRRQPAARHLHRQRLCRQRVQSDPGPGPCRGALVRGRGHLERRDRCKEHCGLGLRRRLRAGRGVSDWAR